MDIKHEIEARNNKIMQLNNIIIQRENELQAYKDEKTMEIGVIRFLSTLVESETAPAPEEINS